MPRDNGKSNSFYRYTLNVDLDLVYHINPPIIYIVSRYPSYAVYPRLLNRAMLFSRRIDDKYTDAKSTEREER